MTAESFDLSVVIGAQQARHTIEQCLQPLVGATNLRTEIIVVDASTDGTNEIVRQRFPQVTLLRDEPGTLMPRLWGRGIEHARGPIVGILNAQCIPAADWANTVVRLMAQHPEAAGIGGPIEGPTNGAPRDWAVYFTRYSAYMPPIKAGTVNEIPGDNAAYRAAALEQFWIDHEGGFWETLFHRELHNAGQHLLMAPDMRVQLGRSMGAAQFARSRVRHGYHYGSTRTAPSPAITAARVLAAPLLMPLLQARIGRRVVGQRRDLLPTYLRALPWSTAFLSAWSYGEVQGYLAHATGPR